MAERMSEREHRLHVADLLEDALDRPREELRSVVNRAITMLRAGGVVMVKEPGENAEPTQAGSG